MGRQHTVRKALVYHGGAGTNPLSKVYTVGFKATGRLKRTDFGISKYAPLVGDDVALTISAAFEKSN